MSDLKSQLQARFGASPAVSEPEPAPDAMPPELGPMAHMGSVWQAKLRFYRTLPGGPSVPEKPSLEAARQLTDRIAKTLKKAGRTREANDLTALRNAWLAQRDKLAWGEVKRRFTDLGLSERAYRSLRQGDADALAVLTRLLRADVQELSAMGTARLDAFLGG